MNKSTYIKVLMLFICIGTTFIYSQNVPTTVKEMYGVDEVTILSGPNLDKTTGGKWTAGTNMPHARFYGGSVVYTRNDTSWLYVLGGDTTGGGVATATCLRYNINTDSWEYIAPLPEPLRLNAAALLGDKIYTMGGFNAPFPAPAVNSFYEYDIITDTWTTLPDLPFPLFFHGAFGFEDSLIYILGGIRDDTTAQDDLWLSDVLYFNIDVPIFTDASDMPEATAGFGLAVKGRRIFITAGLKNLNELFNFTFEGTIDQIDPSRIEWDGLINYPESVYKQYSMRFDFPAIEVIYSGGGSNTTGFTPIDDAYVYFIDTGEYKPAENLPVPNMGSQFGDFCLGCTPPGELNIEEEMVVRLVIAGGIIPGPALSNQTWIFTDTVKVVGINEIENTIPEDYALLQNYPNPFNPLTSIEYSIPEESFVELKVYDILGNEVASLVNEQQQAGVYRAEFTADNLPSGMYFTRLTANEFTQVVKMILIK